MKYGPIFSGVAVVSLMLVGPVGPCGPSSLLGNLFLLVGLYGGLAGWVICGVALVSIVRNSQTRSKLPRALLVGALSAAPPALIVQGLYMSHGGRGCWPAVYLGVYAWPPLVTMIMAYRIRKTHQHSGSMSLN